jgi:hypothetical protein
VKLYSNRGRFPGLWFNAEFIKFCLKEREALVKINEEEISYLDKKINSI